MGFGKMWNPGDTGIVIYPWFKDSETGNFELLVALRRGHKAQPKELSIKASFIPSLCEFDENDNVVGAGDFTYQFSKIAPCFVAGQKELELSRIREKENINESMRHDLITQVDKKFDKDNVKGVKPVVGGLTYIIATECVYVPMKDNKPDIENASLVSQALSDTRINQLYALANDPKFAPMPIEGMDDMYALEVQYSFPAGDKTAAGKAAPLGLAPEYRLEATHPQQYAAIHNIVMTLPQESETIEKRNYSFQKFSENMIRQSLTQYAVMQTEYIDALTETSNEEMIERIEKNARVFEELNITRSLKNQDIIDKISAALELQHAQESNMDNTEPTTTSEESTNIPVGSPTIQQLLEAEHVGDEDSIAALDSVDFGE